MIELKDVTFLYPGGKRPALRGVSWTAGPGQFVLVVGPSGSGKSTLLRTLDGLVPHFSGGSITGLVSVAGHDPIAEGPHAMSRVVGLVQQDPEAQFVVDTVEDELAFAMENQGLPQPVMRKRVEEVLDQLAIAHLRQRRITSLSAGEKQRVAIGAVLTLQPKVLVLDEPTSQLDPQSAEEVLTALRHLNEDLGLTVVLSEHRLERVVQYADQLVYLPAPGEPPCIGDPRRVLPHMPFAPPLVKLARALGWEPLPLTIKEARPMAAMLQIKPADRREHEAGAAVSVEAHDLWFEYDGIAALAGFSMQAARGQVIALMGRNGSGKTTVLKHLAGLLRPRRGSVVVDGLDTRSSPTDDVLQRVGYVPQDPSALLFADTVRQELEFTRHARGLPAVDIGYWLDALDLAGLGDRYPRELSVGQRQRVALAAILVAEAPILLLDEPTRGLDPNEKEWLAEFLRSLSNSGRTVIMATHDVELAASCSHRVVIMGAGQVVVDGPAREVMSHSLVFATQMNKLFGDPRLLTVRDVLEALP